MIVFIQKRSDHVSIPGRDEPLAGGQGMQDVNGVSDVQALSEPAGLRCLRVDANPLGLVQRAEHPDGIGGDRGQRRTFR